MKDKPKKEPPKMAAAIQYIPENDHAPRLIAYGEGDIAEAILEVAKENEIPLHQDKALVQLLSTLEIGTEIPEEAYHVVAEVLAFVYHLQKKTTS